MCEVLLKTNYCMDDHWNAYHWKNGLFPVQFSRDIDNEGYVRMTKSWQNRCHNLDLHLSYVSTVLSAKKVRFVVFVSFGHFEECVQSISHIFHLRRHSVVCNDPNCTSYSARLFGQLQETIKLPMWQLDIFQLITLISSMGLSLPDRFECVSTSKMNFRWTLVLVAIHLDLHAF